jgi:hypothetical protein
MNMKDFRHFSCGTLHGEVGQIRSYRPPFRRALGLIIHFIGLYGKGYFRLLHASSRRRTGRRKRMQKARCLRPDADAL